MATIFNSNTKSKPKTIAGSVFEQVKDLATSTVKSTVTEAGKIASGVPGGILKGPSTYSEAGVNPNISQSPENYPQRQENLIPKHAPEIMLFNRFEREEEVRVEREIKILMNEIKREVVLLEKRQKMFIAEASKLTMQAMPEKIGIYHVRFFEWILALLRDLHKKVSESATWFSHLQTKRQKKGFWGMAKKHGASFTLSGERAIATQAG